MKKKKLGIMLAIIPITDCNIVTKTVVIPDKIEGKPVTSIGDCAFLGCDIIVDTMDD